MHHTLKDMVEKDKDSKRERRYEYVNTMDHEKWSAKKKSELLIRKRINKRLEAYHKK